MFYSKQNLIIVQSYRRLENMQNGNTKAVQQCTQHCMHLFNTEIYEYLYFVVTAATSHTKLK